MRETVWLDVEAYDGTPAPLPDLPAEPPGVGAGEAWLGALGLHWRKLLAVLVCVLVFGGVAANATMPPLQQNGPSLAPVALRGPTPALTAWTPASECSRITPSDLKPGHYTATMRWCAYTANALHEGDVRGRWTWNPGDLTRLMALFSCESGGNPRAKNPASSASGLGQFLNGTWNRWAPRAASFFDFDNPNRFMAYDSILTTVYLAKVDSFGHWRCWSRYTS